MSKHSHTTIEWDHDGDPQVMKSGHSDLAMILVGDMKFTLVSQDTVGSFIVGEFSKIREDYSHLTATVRTWDCHGTALSCK